MKIVCFHNPDEDNGYLSNWYPCRFKTENITFSSMEQYMMYHKAISFDDMITAAKILSMNDPERFERSKWKGQNLLGYTLMMVRERV